MTTCQHCAKAFEDRKHPDRKFCSHHCAMQSRLVIGSYKCEMCGKAFSRKPKATGYRFCSRACSNRTQIKDPHKRATSICPRCGKSFETWAYRKQKYCSRQCNGEVSSRRPRPNARNPNLYVVKPCAHCGKPHKFNIHQIRLRGGKHCSKACKYAALSKNMSGPRNANFVDGTHQDPRGPDWGKQARKVRKRDNYTCQVCGVQWTRGNKVLTDVHHIIPFRHFNGDLEHANALSNLIVLCRHCHVKVERGLLPCPIPTG